MNMRGPSKAVYMRFFFLKKAQQSLENKGSKKHTLSRKGKEVDLIRAAFDEINEGVYPETELCPSNITVSSHPGKRSEFQPPKAFLKAHAVFMIADFGQSITSSRCSEGALKTIK
jgi:hypothetical protein